MSDRNELGNALMDGVVAVVLIGGCLGLFKCATDCTHTKWLAEHCEEQNKILQQENISLRNQLSSQPKVPDCPHLVRSDVQVYVHENSVVDIQYPDSSLRYKFVEQVVERKGGASAGFSVRDATEIQNAAELALIVAPDDSVFKEFQDYRP